MFCLLLKLVVVLNDQLKFEPCIVHADCKDRVKTTVWNVNKLLYDIPAKKKKYIFDSINSDRIKQIGYAFNCSF